MQVMFIKTCLYYLCIIQWIVWGGVILYRKKIVNKTKYKSSKVPPMRKIVTNWLSCIFLCLLTPATLNAQDASYCTQPASYNFVSKQDGPWSSASTWVGNVAPSHNLASGQRVLITHNVTRTTSANSDFKPASNTTVVIRNGGFLYTNQIQQEQASTIIVDYGKLHVIQNFQQKTTNARICGIHACIIVDENYQIESGSSAYFRSSSLDIGGNTSGSLQVTSSSVDGSDIRIWVRNGNFQGSSATWTGAISKYRVSGSVSGIPSGSRPASQTSAAAMAVEMNTCTYTPLPLHILYFNAHAEKNGTSLLEWATTEEKNNDHFEVESSTDARNWNVIGFVYSKTDNKGSETKYDFTDNMVFTCTHYYRLKQINVDGSYKYSTINTINATGHSDIEIYPNPVPDHVTVTGLQSHSSIIITNPAGQIKMSLQSENETVKTVDMSTFASGIYFISVVDEHGKSKSYKVVKM